MKQNDKNIKLEIYKLEMLIVSSNKITVILMGGKTKKKKEKLISLLLDNI